MRCDRALTRTHEAQDFLRVHAAGHADDGRQHETDEQGLSGKLCRAFRVLLADPPCHERGDGHAETDRDGVQQRHDGFGHTQRRNRVGAEARDEKDVDDREHRLHQHLEHHRDREQDDRALIGSAGEILRRADE